MSKNVLKKVFEKFTKDVFENEEHIKIMKKYESWFKNFGEDYTKSFRRKEQLDLMSIDVNDAVIVKPKLEKFYDEKGNASHYNQNRLNTMLKYEVVWGTLGVMVFCEINAEKYKDRLGKKDNQSPEQELVKIRWYEDAAKFYFNRLSTSQEVKVDNKLKQNNPWENE